jgi:hypothetical protein
MYPVALASAAAAATAARATPQRTVRPRFRMRTPSQRASAQSANSMPSGLIDDDMKVAMGWNPTTPAAASWSSRFRPNSSPARSQVAVTLTSRSSADQRRMA